MKKALVISYYFPPSGKASLQLPLGIIKNLRSFGIEPIILTVDEDSFSERDDSFLQALPQGLKVYRTSILEPFGLYRIFTGKSRQQKLVPSEMISLENKSLSHRLSIWIRMNLFIPDARIGWYPYAVNKFKSIIRDNKIDYILSFGPPHTAHLIARTIAHKYHLPYYPILIDPWTDIAYYREFQRSSITLAIDNYFEKQCLIESRHCFFVTENLKNDYCNKYPELKEKSTVLYWGFENDAFTNVEKEQVASDFILLHAGNIFDYQNPEILWKTLREMNDSGRRVSMHFIGSVSPIIKKSIEENGLQEHTVYHGFLPYPEMINKLCNADALLVCPTESRHVPGKLFEYLRSGKPILCIGEQNDEVQNIIAKLNAGIFISKTENPTEFFSNISNYTTDQKQLNRFERKSVTEILVKEISR
ncbi:MAG: glycosyltransferase [Ignavibacteria bacterium]|nr:glycosyltransferase [Ignavibacteria bacterium]